MTSWSLHYVLSPWCQSMHEGYISALSYLPAPARSCHRNAAQLGRCEPTTKQGSWVVHHQRPAKPSSVQSPARTTATPLQPGGQLSSIPLFPWFLQKAKPTPVTKQPYHHFAGPRASITILSPKLTLNQLTG